MCLSRLSLKETEEACLDALKQIVTERSLLRYA
jgi:hypothetical protein